MRPVGLGGEFVDHRRVESVLALVGALDVALLAAPFAQEVARQPLAIRAAPASAFCDQGGAAALQDRARLSRHFWHACAGVPSRLIATLLRQRLWAHFASPVWSLAGGTKPGGSLPLHWAMRVESSMSFSVSGLRREVRRSRTGGTRAQPGHLAPARSEPAENPPGLTGRARVTRWSSRRTEGNRCRNRDAVTANDRGYESRYNSAD